MPRAKKTVEAVETVEAPPPRKPKVTNDVVFHRPTQYSQYVPAKVVKVKQKKLPITGVVIDVCDLVVWSGSFPGNNEFREDVQQGPLPYQWQFPEEVE